MAGNFDPIDRCPDCGWTFGGFHLCTKFEGPEPTPKFVPQGRPFDGTFTEEVREKISEANRARWAEYRKKLGPRNAKIIEDYSEGHLGMKALAEKYGLGYATIRRILIDASEEGIVVIRSRGATIAKGA